MRIATRPLAGFVSAGLLATGLTSHAISPVTFNFDSYSTGNLAGQSGWGSEGFGGQGTTQVAAGGGGSTVNYAAFDGTSGSSASAWNVGAFGTVTGTENFRLQFDFLSGNSPAVYVGLGWDNSTGQLDFNDPSSQLGFAVLASKTNVELFLNGSSLGSVAQNYADGAWRSIQVQVNLSANSGAGTASVFGKSASSSSVSPIAGLQNIGLTLNRNGVDASDPTKWNTLWLHEAGPGAGLDNIILVPEPGAAALALTGLAGAFLARRRRRN